MLYIGFAGTFYTLWDVDSRIEYDAEGRPNQKVNYWYIQNLSIELEKAQQSALAKGVLETNLEPDMELFGRNSSFYGEKKLYCDFPDHASLFFKFGKYRDQAIIKCTDIKYLSWYQEQTGNVHAQSVLLQNGYKLYTFNYDDGTSRTYVVSEEQYLKYIAQDERKAQQGNILEQIESGELTKTKVVLESNLSYEGMSFNNSLDLNLSFQFYKLMSYSGFEYALPTINGVGKKVKGKEIEVEFAGVEIHVGTGQKQAVVKSFKVL